MSAIVALVGFEPCLVRELSRPFGVTSRRTGHATVNITRPTSRCGMHARETAAVRLPPLPKSPTGYGYGRSRAQWCRASS